MAVAQRSGRSHASRFDREVELLAGLGEIDGGGGHLAGAAVEGFEARAEGGAERAILEGTGEEIFTVTADHVTGLNVGKDVLGAADELVEAGHAEDGHVDPRGVAPRQDRHDSRSGPRGGVLEVDPELDVLPLRVEEVD